MSVERKFTADWSGSRDYWRGMFESRGMVGKPNLHFLEVGCYEGRSALWLLENVLTHPSSKITVIDTFEPFDGFNTDRHSRELFDSNTAEYQESRRLLVRQGDSKEILRRLWGKFDFIYIDGSHKAADVLSDAVYSWPLLKTGGIMAFDDYEWGLGEPAADRPNTAIDAFLACFQPQVIHRAYQVAVEKP